MFLFNEEEISQRSSNNTEGILWAEESNQQGFKVESRLTGGPNEHFQEPKKYCQIEQFLANPKNNKKQNKSHKKRSKSIHYSIYDESSSSNSSDSSINSSNENIIHSRENLYLNLNYWKENKIEREIIIFREGVNNSEFVLVKADKGVLINELGNAIMEDLLGIYMSKSLFYSDGELLEDNEKLGELEKIIMFIYQEGPKEIITKKCKKRRDNHRRRNRRERSETSNSSENNTDEGTDNESNEEDEDCEEDEEDDFEGEYDDILEDSCEDEEDSCEDEEDSESNYDNYFS